MNCPKCGKENPSHKLTCDYCGFALKSNACPKCRNAIVEGAEFCIKCGFKLATSSVCSKCNRDNPKDAVFCAGCGNRLGGGFTNQTNTTVNTQYQYSRGSSPNYPGLSPYYQEEFRKIYDSNETYQGKWNWAACLFGAFWALSKKLWVAGFLYLILAVISITNPFAGLLCLVYAIVLGVRGNYMYYAAYSKNRQLPF